VEFLLQSLLGNNVGQLFSLLPERVTRNVYLNSFIESMILIIYYFALI
jgi:hypothetical protein